MPHEQQVTENDDACDGDGGGYDGDTRLHPDGLRQRVDQHPGEPGSPCPGRPGEQTTFLADGTTTVHGAFAVTGYVQTAECGPDVPDDVQYDDAGARRTLILPADVEVELLGTTMTDPNPRPATLADLEPLLRAQFATPRGEATVAGFMLWSSYFQLTFGADGRVTGITGIFRP